MASTGTGETKEDKDLDVGEEYSEEAFEVHLAPAERVIDASEDLTEHIIANVAPENADQEVIEDVAEEIVEHHIEAQEVHFE